MSKWNKCKLYIHLAIIFLYVFSEPTTLSAMLDQLTIQHQHKLQSRLISLDVSSKEHFCHSGLSKVFAVSTDAYILRFHLTADMYPELPKNLECPFIWVEAPRARVNISFSHFLFLWPFKDFESLYFDFIASFVIECCDFSRCNTTPRGTG